MSINKSGVQLTTKTDRDPPGHDVFCTPENSEFHAKTTYKILDTSRREIRLISLLPDNSRGLIECELLDRVPLADVRNQYYALSYCAGDAHKTDVVLVNGIRCTVFANLKHALESAQHFWKQRSTQERLLLWVDQICINQYDLSERSHQVGIMRDIYQSAQHTLICLSTFESSSKGLEWLLGLSEHVPRLDDDLVEETLIPHRVELPENRNSDNKTSKGPPERHHWHRLLKYMCQNVVDEEFVNGWIAFYDIVQSPWWNRAWVFQEFIVSPAPLFIYWHSSASWQNLSYVLHSLCSLHKDDLIYRDYFLKLTGFEAGGVEDRNFSRVINRIEHADTQTLDTMFFMVKAKFTWAGSLGFTQLLAHSRYCKTSDPRDKIYAFLGLADPAYAITPNYSSGNDIVDVLVETTKQIIVFENGLDVLHHAAAPTLARPRMLPSWVADWTSKEVCTYRNGIFRWGVISLSPELTKSSANASFRLMKTRERPQGTLGLEVSGVFVEPLIEEQVDYMGNRERVKFWGYSTKNFVVSSKNHAKCSDELWILYGATSPVVLRRELCGYSLIGCAVAIPKEGSQTRRLGAIVEEMVERQELKRERILIL